MGIRYVSIPDSLKIALDKSFHYLVIHSIRLELLNTVVEIMVC